MPASDPIMASVDLWPVSWAPNGWAICDGTLLPITQYSALYSLLGTYFGGNGQTTFGLPDLRGRVAVGAGINPATGTNYPYASKGGLETVQLTAVQGPLAAHTHPATVVDPNFAATATGTIKPGASSAPRGVVYSNTPVNNFPVALPSGSNNYATTADSSMGADNSVAITVNVSKSSSGSVTVGQNSALPAAQAHENRMPYLALNYIIALTGEYPMRP